MKIVLKFDFNEEEVFINDFQKEKKLKQAIIELDSNDFDDIYELKLFLASKDLKFAIDDLYQEARKLWKYSDDEEKIKIGEAMRDMISDCVSRYPSINGLD